MDTPSAIVTTFTAVFDVMQIPVPTSQNIRATIGLPLSTAFSNLLGLPAHDKRVDVSVELYQRFYRELIVPQARELLVPGVAAGLSFLREQGFALAIATSKFQASADLLLRQAELGNQFDLVIGADQVNHPKPHPESGSLILNRLGFSNDQAVMVGDTIHDLLMAKASGMDSIAVTYGIHSYEILKSQQPTWIAHSFDEVISYLKGQGGLS